MSQSLTLAQIVRGASRWNPPSPGPKCCPGCGATSVVSNEGLIRQLARLSVALEMDPTTLLLVFRVLALGTAFR